MTFCPHCGYSNPERADACLRCGRSLILGRPPGPPPLPAGKVPAVRPAVWYGIISLATLLLLGVVCWVERAGVVKVEKRLASELARLNQAHEEEAAAADAAAQRRTAAEEAAHKKRLGNERLLSGAIAREWQAQEWQRRLAHDPLLAASLLETNLLFMERLGHDPSVAAKSALESVARMASPRGSRVEVTSAGDRFAVRVAYKMSEVTADEKGAVTKHHSTASMRREIEALSARLIKELFDYCGSRGIERLSVSCNHTVRQSHIPKAATEAERQHLRQQAGSVMSCLHRVSVDGLQAVTLANWREVSVPQVIRLLRVELDGLTDLTIDGYASPGAQQDANMQLEF
jgi:hypothetical protein